MKLFVRTLGIAFIMTICMLRATASGKFVIAGSNQRPEIAVTVNAAQLQQLKSNLQDGAENILSLHLVTNGIVQALPVAGKYRLEAQQLSYVPLATLGQELDYEIWYITGGDTTRKKYHTHQQGISRQTVQAVTAYPLADTLPANILSFHIRFSAPMRNDNRAYKHVNIYTADGQLLRQVWRQRSFWLDSNRLLVLMIHPGRIKSGIHYIGPVFTAGNPYTLTVDDSLADNDGNAMRAGIVKTFTIAGEDRQIPSLDSVFVANNLKEIVIKFSESMDVATITEGTSVLNNNGEVMACTIREKGDDRTFMIGPVNKIWSPGRYEVRLFKNVSDLAGNRLTRAFEVSNVTDKEKEPEYISKTVEIK